MQKLHRQPDLHSLAQVRDLAGLRVVVRGTRADRRGTHRRAAAGLRPVPDHADSEATLHETHGRYFYTAAELARRLRDTVAAI